MGAQMLKCPFSNHCYSLVAVLTSQDPKPAEECKFACLQIVEAAQLALKKSPISEEKISQVRKLTRVAF